MKIYLASPFFNDEELKAVERAEQIITERGYELYSPRLHEIRTEITGTRLWSEKTFRTDQTAIDACDIVVMLYWGAYSDSGTAWECGYAYSRGKKVIVVHLGNDSNLMVHEGSFTNLSGLEELAVFDFQKPKAKKYTGPML